MWSASYLICLNSGAYERALSYCDENEFLADALGKPFNVRLGLLGGRVSERPSKGSAELTLVISGSKTSGEVNLIMTKDESGWHVNKAGLDSQGRFSELTQ